MSAVGGGRVISDICDFVYPRSKRKMAGVIATKLGTRILDGRISQRIEPEVKRSVIIKCAAGVGTQVDKTD